jgi:hypothetical protein
VSNKFLYPHYIYIVLVVRTGQAHRTLLGHSGPVTCLQFDEIHIMSGSLDKTIRVGLIFLPQRFVLNLVVRYGT